MREIYIFFRAALRALTILLMLLEEQKQPRELSLRARP